MSTTKTFFLSIFYSIMVPLRLVQENRTYSTRVRRIPGNTKVTPKVMHHILFFSTLLPLTEFTESSFPPVFKFNSTCSHPWHCRCRSTLSRWLLHFRFVKINVLLEFLYCENETEVNIHRRSRQLYGDDSVDRSTVS